MGQVHMADFLKIKAWVESAALADLWLVLRDPICGEVGACRLTYAKAELKRRGWLSEAA
jgi:hypothetical protein